MNNHSRRYFVFASCVVALVLFLNPETNAQDLERLEEAAVAAAVKKVESSVLQIETIGGVDRVGQSTASLGPSTGLVVSEDGYMLSSKFNFIHKPASIFVKLNDGQRAACEVVAQDHSRNLVLLKIDTQQKLTVPKFIPRDKLQVGSTAIALGRVFDPASTNLSTGIVSATNRIWGKAIQTDAKISPNNFGGPLIDIEGNVLGILTPLSTRGESETAGSDWYDSGIGFAVPVNEVLAKLDVLKSGKDLHPGRLGVSFKGRNVYADPAEVAALVGTSPAAKGGVRVGDVIVEFGGKKIRRQSELRHAVGPYYAEDEVGLIVERGGKQVSLKVKLAKEIAPFVQPFLGLVFESTADGIQTNVRHVFAESPAAKSGLQVGDVVTKIGGQGVQFLDDVRAALIQLEVAKEIPIQVSRNGKTSDLVIKPASGVAIRPKSMKALEAVDAEPRAPVGKIEIKVPEEANTCHAWVPEKQFLRQPGLLVWLPSPGEKDFEKEAAKWKAICEQYNFILLMPQSSDKSKWLPEDAEYIAKAIAQFKLSHSFDRHRVVFGGMSSGGSMAAIAAMRNRDLARGLILVNATVPRTAGRIAADPVNPLLVLVADMAAKEKSEAPKALKAFEAAKIPAVAESWAGKSWVQQIGEWMDSVDRF